jgi:hypothetical protein
LPWGQRRGCGPQIPEPAVLCAWVGASFPSIVGVPRFPSPAGPLSFPGPLASAWTGQGWVGSTLHPAPSLHPMQGPQREPVPKTGPCSQEQLEKAGLSDVTRPLSPGAPVDHRVQSTARGLQLPTNPQHGEDGGIPAREAICRGHGQTQLHQQRAPHTHMSRGQNTCPASHSPTPWEQPWRGSTPLATDLQALVTGTWKFVSRTRGSSVSFLPGVSHSRAGCSLFPHHWGPCGMLS